VKTRENKDFNQGDTMSLISRNSPRRIRERQKKPFDEPIIPEVKVEPQVPIEPEPSPATETDKLIEAYAYRPDLEPEPVQEITPVVVPVLTPEATSFDLFDLSFFCEQRIFSVLFSPMDIKTRKVLGIARDSIYKKLEVYSEYTQDAIIGSFKETLYYYKNEVLIPEEFLNISGFMRKFLNIERVYVLYETGEIILTGCEFCNFWLHRVQQFFEPKNKPLERPAILDEEICLDCNLVCNFRRSQQMTK
jgi:hypothetical protein